LKVTGKIQPGAFTKYLGKLYRQANAGFEVMLSKSHIDEMVSAAGLDGSAGAGTPGSNSSRPASLQEKEIWDTKLEGEDVRLYRAIVGKLRWIVPERPDLGYAVHEVSKKLSSPAYRDWVAVKRIVRYLHKTTGTTLWLSFQGPRNEHKLEIYTDTNFAADSETRKSTSCAAVFYNCGLVHFHARGQSTIATSTAEAELYGVCSGLCEGLAIRSLLQELGENVCTLVYTDSDAGRAICSKSGLSKTKHVQVKYQWVQEVFKKRMATIHRCDSATNVADLGTKHLARDRMLYLSEKLGLRDEVNEKNDNIVSVVKEVVALGPRGARKTNQFWNAESYVVMAVVAIFAIGLGQSMRFVLQLLRWTKKWRSRPLCREQGTQTGEVQQGGRDVEVQTKSGPTKEGILVSAWRQVSFE
jgi:hypothetical protein